MCRSVCSRTVREVLNIGPFLIFFFSRNQHITKTSIPTSEFYISPVDRKTPNFVEQFEGMRLFSLSRILLHLSHLHPRQWYDRLDTFPFCSGRLVSSFFVDPLVNPFFTSSLSLALEFRQWLGGEHKINAYCHDLALKGGKQLAEMWGTRLMDPTGEFTLNMVCPLKY